VIYYNAIWNVLCAEASKQSNSTEMYLIFISCKVIMAASSPGHPRTNYSDDIQELTGMKMLCCHSL